MNRRRTGRRIGAALAASVVLLALPATAASAGPVLGCGTPPAPATLDGRVFSEPRFSLTFLRFDEFECGMGVLDAAYPDLVEITNLGESLGGAPIYDILLTDETVSTPKRKLLVVSSIHGGEVGGREGAVRVIEDMLDPELLGDEPWVQQVLDEFVIHFLFPNPDGWLNGDVINEYSPPNGPDDLTGATRGNEAGHDLNRRFPVKGYIYTPNRTGDPEAVHINEQLFPVDGSPAEGWYLGTDNHGQGPDTYAAAGLQIVGQFDYQKSETLARFADDIDDAMAEYDVLGQLQAIGDGTGLPIGPYEWGTLYDMLGYSASGSLIDYYNTADRTAGTGFATELTVGTEVMFAAHPMLLNQVWVDSIRAINFTMFKHAIDPKQFTYEVGSRAAYLFDPDVVRHDDANGAGYDPDEDAGETEGQSPYAVTRMKFFEDLNLHADQPLTEIRVGEILDGSVDLDTFDSLVISDDPMPEDGDAAAWYAELRAWVERGGNLVLTDGALTALAELGLLEADAIAMFPGYVGSVDEFVDRDQPLNANLRGLASQTFDTVPIGYAFPPNGENAPNWTIDPAAWEAAGGVTAGLHQNGTANEDTAGASDSLTIYGELPVGDGRVRVLGALLPQPSEDYYHPFGLLNYAVVYTGYTLLQNMLVWDNPARVAQPTETPTTPGPTTSPTTTTSPGGSPTPSVAPTATSTTPGGGSPLPTTGGGLIALAVTALGSASLLAARRVRGGRR